MTGVTDDLPGRLSASIAEGGIFGREPELESIAAAIDAARAEVPSAVVVTGEPGMGKTRLVAEVAGIVRHRGRRVLYGRSEEGMDGAYQPFAECLEQLLGDRAPVDGRSWPGAPELGRLVPGLDPRATSRAAGERSGERYLLFDAVRVALTAASRATPLLLVLEDLHWADGATLLLLRHVLSAPEAPDAVFLLTVRSGELHESDALAAALTEPERRDGVRRLTLAGLGVDDVARLVGERGGAPPAPTEAQRLCRDAGGNPFFVKELLRSRESGTVPEGVRSVIRRRTALLGEEVAGVLTVAAVAGRDLDVELISAVSGHSVERVLDALGTAERAGLVIDRGGTAGVGFAHALVQQALYAELPASRRGALHRRFAEALDATPDGAARPDVLRHARHWLAALPQDPGRVGLAALRAGLLTLERRDPDAAARWFEHALEAAGRTGDEAARTEALIGLGGALLGKGDPAARAVLLEAARLAHRREDRGGLIRAALRNHRGFASRIGHVDAERVAMLEAALEAVGAQDSADRALLLNTLATEMYFSSEDPERSLALGEEAVTIARRIGDPYTLGTVLAPRQARWSPEGLDEQARGTEESVAIADRVGDPLLQLRALRWRGMALLSQGRVEEAEQATARQDGLAQQFGDPTARFLSTHDRSSLALVRGRLVDAETLADQTLAMGLEAGQPDAHAFYANALGAIRWDQGRLGELVELAAAAVGRSPHVPAQRPLLALAYGEAGLHDDAARVLAVDAATRFGELPHDVTWLVAVTAYAHVAADVRDRAAADCLLDLLAPWHGRIAWNSAAWGGVDLALGRLALTADRLGEAGQHLARARSLAERWGAPVWHARVTLEQARLLLRLDDDVEAISMLERTRAEASRLGAGGVARQAGTLLQRTRSARALAGSAGGMRIELRASPEPAGPAELEARPNGRDAARAVTLALNGATWTITDRARRISLPDGRGMRYLATLLEHPGVERHATELQAGATGQATASGHAGPLLDEQARRAYRARLEDLEEALEEAERFGDSERASGAREERELIGRELATAVGLDGRARRAGDVAERARINVTRALVRAVTAIERGDAALAHHLRNALRTGAFCVYDPPPTDRVAWLVERSS